MKSDPLSQYRAKRSLDSTTEPAGTVARTPGRLYVFHKHAASHLHFDLRLEMEGVLRSWAVPKGPSLDPAEKRLAVHVEDHPVEYGDFEGKIPEGNYGAGAVILWDRGSWRPIGDPLEGLEKGKLLFELQGYKLRGTWTLVKIKRAAKEWLLIKERDAYAVAGPDELPEGSVLSGRTVEDLRDDVDPAAPIREELERLGAPRRVIPPADLKPMLAETREQPFSKPGWVFELKVDGYRILARRAEGEATLLTRNGRDATATFPEIARSVAALPFEGLVLDGEIIAVDEAGRPSFQRLQQRAKLTRPIEVRRASLENPTVYYVFDLLAFEGFDLRPLPLTARKALLERVLPPAGPLPFMEHFAEQGEALFEQVTAMGLEGIMAKRADAPYRAGRSPAWLKIRADRTDEFVVVGCSPPQGSRDGFGALHLADFVGGKLTYAGRVGSGFTDAELRGIRETLEAARQDAPACVGPLPTGAEHVWVRPALVAEVRYKEWTDEGLLRHPVFLRFREDKPVSECVRRGTAEETLDDPVPVEAAPVVREVKVSNLDKVFWPDEGYTKGDLIAYYEAIAPWLLPYLRNRPVVLTRYPDGIAGKSFFQKDAPTFVPEWLRTERMWSEQAQREIDYFICDDAASLTYIANMAAIPLHIWGSRIDALERPDWCILDLDPKEAPFEHVVRVALSLHALCERIALPHFVKTSGSSGLHVLVPLARQLTFEQCRSLGELLARVVVTELPEIATIARTVSRRDGRVYVDFLQNGHGRLLAAPFSVRPLPGAPVSLPIVWDEVTPALDLRAHTIMTVPPRMRERGVDPMIGVLGEVPDLLGALGRLYEIVGGGG